jgi:hypothetical protein
VDSRLRGNDREEILHFVQNDIGGATIRVAVPATAKRGVIVFGGENDTIVLLAIGRIEDEYGTYKKFFDNSTYRPREKHAG